MGKFSVLTILLSVLSWSFAQDLSKAKEQIKNGLFEDAKSTYHSLMLSSFKSGDEVTFYKSSDGYRHTCSILGYDFDETIADFKQFNQNFSTDNPKLNFLANYFLFQYLIEFRDYGYIEDDLGKYSIRVAGKIYEIDYSTNDNQKRITTLIQDLENYLIEQASLFKATPISQFEPEADVREFPNFAIFLLNKIDYDSYDFFEEREKNFPLSKRKKFETIENILLDAGDKEAFIIWHLKHLEVNNLYVETDSTTTEKQIKQLQKLIEKYKDQQNVLGLYLSVFSKKISLTSYQYNPKTKFNSQFLSNYYDTLNVLVTKYPLSFFGKNGKNLLASISNKSLIAELDQLDDTRKKAVLSLKYQNVEEAFLRIYKKNSTTGSIVIQNEKYDQVYALRIPLEQNGKYNQHVKQVVIPDFKEDGSYYYVIAREASFFDSLTTNLEKEVHRTQWDFTTLSLVNTKIGYSYFIIENKLYFNAFDKATGKGIVGISMSKQTKKDEFTSFGSTDKNGRLVFEIPPRGSREYSYSYTISDNKGWTENINIYNSNPKIGKNEGAYILTDRGMYRPGETVYFKLYQYEGEAWNLKAVANRAVEFNVKDNNGSFLTTQKGRTNEFGTWSGSFVLPTAGFQFGRIYLQSDLVVKTIQVEEYKLPALQIQAKFSKEIYQKDEAINLSGEVTGMTGNTIPNAKVLLRIEEATYHWRMRGKVLIDTVVYTDKYGCFQYDFNWKKSTDFGSNLTANIQVVSPNGELIKSETSTFVGTRNAEVSIESTVFTTSVHTDKLIIRSSKENEKYELIISKEESSTKNAFVNSEFSNFTEKEFSNWFKNYVLVDEIKEAKTTEVFRGKVSGKDSLQISKILKSTGNYQIQLMNQNGQKLFSSELAFVQLTDKKAKLKRPTWLKVIDSELTSNQALRFILGSNGVKRNFEVILSNQFGIISIQQHAIKGNKIITYQPTEKDYPGINIMVRVIENGQAIFHSEQIKFSSSIKEFDVNWITKKSDLSPSTQVNWELEIKNDKPTEMLALLVDEANNSLAPNSILINPYVSRTFYISKSASYNQKNHAFDAYFDYYNSYLNREDRVVMDAVGNGIIQMKTAAPSVTNDRLESDIVVEEESDDEESVESKARKNFNETAFFYPNLREKEGKVIIDFNLPDAVTTWNFQALTHTKDFEMNYLKESFVAKKEVMIQPNVPRFVRKGDEFTLTASVVNFAGLPIDKTTVEFFDPFTNKVIDVVSTPIEVTNSSASQTSLYGWKIRVPESEIAALAIRYSVKSQKHTDVVERVIPVLSNEVALTESIPLSYTKEGSYVLPTASILNKTANQKNHLLTVEIISRPEWFALNSVPVIFEDNSDNPISWVDKYYMQEKISELIQANKYLGTMFNDLRALDKNYAMFDKTEIKTAMLEETPWLLEAKTASDQHNRLAYYLNENQLKMNKANWISKISDLQNSDGSFSWYPGMKGSTMITMTIVERLFDLNDTKHAFYQKAIAYLDQQMEKNYQLNAKNKIVPTLSSEIISWLKISNKKSSDAYKSYLELTKKEWTKLSLGQQANLALTMNLLEQNELAENIWKSIDNRKKTDATLGIYWNRPNQWWNWGQNQIGTQASILKLYQVLNKSENQIQQIRWWLIQQKRGQLWESTKTTVDVCAALLSEVKMESVKIGRFEYDQQNVDLEEFPFGYFKYSFHPSELKNAPVFNKKSNNLVFVNVSVDYSTTIENVKNNVAGLKVDRRYYRVVNGVENEVAGDEIQKGDQIRVKLFIQSDRDLDYVVVKDSRGQGFETINATSGYVYGPKMSYYLQAKDASTDLYVERLPKGTHQVSYDVFATVSGTIQLGYTTVESVYAPEFKANTSSRKMKIQ